MMGHWSTEKIYFESPIFFRELCLQIDLAKKSIEMEFYIFSLDSVGQQVLDALRRAARRGVRVRLVVDGVGSPEWNRKTILALRKEKVFVRIYHPPSRMLNLAVRFLQTLNFARFTLFIGRLNQRNHRKLCVVDRQFAWIGSMNVTVAHAQWRETGTMVEGPSMSRIITSFEWIWRRSRGLVSDLQMGKRWLEFRKKNRFTPPKTDQFYSLVRINLSPSLRRKTRARMLLDFSRTKKRLWMMNAYFIPLPSIIRALREAVKRGVDVRLMVPEKSDVGFMTFAIEAFYPTLLNAGVRIFEYRPSMMHSKVNLFDHKATVGSSNLNHRSLIHDFELDVELRKMESLALIEKQFLKDSVQCQEVTWDYLDTFHWFKRAIGSMVLLMRYWI